MLLRCVKMMTQCFGGPASFGMQNHRNLRVWRQAHDLPVAVRRAIRDYPRNGYSSLISQTVRSAESVPFNIVEGCAAATNPEFARFLDMSIKSTSEREEQLELAKDYEILNPERWQTLTANVTSVRKQLYALRTRVLGS